MSKFGAAFDLEGTIVDVESAHHRAHLAVAEELGIKIDLTQALSGTEHFIGGPDDKIMSEILVFGDKQADINAMLIKDKYYYKKFLAEIDIAPRSGFLEFLQAIKAANFEVAIGSLTARLEADLLISRSGLDKVFDADRIVYREDVHELKPAPDVYLETAKRMNILPVHQIIFEDSPRGILAGIGAGSPLAIGMPVYNSADVKNELIKAGAKFVYASWSEVDVKLILKTINN